MRKYLKVCVELSNSTIIIFFENFISEIFLLNRLGSVSSKTKNFQEEGENGCPIPAAPLLSPISTERLEQIEKEANQFRSKLNPGKPIFPKKRWADVKIRVLDTKNDSPNGNSGETVTSVNRTEAIPVMSGKPAAFTVDEYDFDRDGSPKPIDTRLASVVEIVEEADPKLNHVTGPSKSPIGSTNGTTISTTPVNLRKNFKKQIAADWENRVSTALLPRGPTP